VADNSPVEAVLGRFALPRRRTYLGLLNGVFVPPEARTTTCLQDGDVLAVWPPIAGG